MKIKINHSKDPLFKQPGFTGKDPRVWISWLIWAFFASPFFPAAVGHSVHGALKDQGFPPENALNIFSLEEF